jgi:hypothetical protein
MVARRFREEAAVQLFVIALVRDRRNMMNQFVVSVVFLGLLGEWRLGGIARECRGERVQAREREARERCQGLRESIWDGIKPVGRSVQKFLTGSSLRSHLAAVFRGGITVRKGGWT